MWEWWPCGWAPCLHNFCSHILGVRGVCHVWDGVSGHDVTTFGDAFALASNAASDTTWCDWEISDTWVIDAKVMVKNNYAKIFHVTSIQDLARVKSQRWNASLILRRDARTIRIYILNVCDHIDTHWITSCCFNITVSRLFQIFYTPFILRSHFSKHT